MELSINPTKYKALFLVSRQRSTNIYTTEYPKYSEIQQPVTHLCLLEFSDTVHSCCFLLEMNNKLRICIHVCIEV